MAKSTIFQELVAELRARGPPLPTRRGDKRKSSSMPGNNGARIASKRFRGMFAFALYDRNSQILFLAREPAGEEAALLHRRGRGRYLLFASELKALLAHPMVEKAP